MQTRQIQHLFVDAVATGEGCNGELMSVEQLLMDSGKLGITPSELHALLTQYLTQRRKQPFSSSTSSSKCRHHDEYENVNNRCSGDQADENHCGSRAEEQTVEKRAPSFDDSRVLNATAIDEGVQARSIPPLGGNLMKPYRTKTKANLSVRFENENDNVVDEEKDTRKKKNRIESSRYRRRRYNRKNADDDSDSYCSTCSSSSSSSDDSTHVYQLPTRRTYAGGTRISYVPNDMVAIARRQQQSMTVIQSPHKNLQDDRNCVIS